MYAKNNNTVYGKRYNGPHLIQSTVPVGYSATYRNINYSMTEIPISMLPKNSNDNSKPILKEKHIQATKSKNDIMIKHINNTY